MRFIYSCLAIFFPASIMLIYDNPVGALIALLLQSTIIGWIPAAIWAWRVVHEQGNSKKQEKKEANSGKTLK